MNDDKIYPITAREGLKDTSTGRPVAVGDVVWIAGYVLPSGELCAETCAIEKPNLWQDAQAKNRASH